MQSGVVLLFQDGVVAEAVLPGEFFGGDALLHPPSNDTLLQVCIPAIQPLPSAGRSWQPKCGCTQACAQLLQSAGPCLMCYL